MDKSSTFSDTGVKLNPRQREKLLEILKPLELQHVIQDGVNQYIGSGTRMLLELLLHAEAQELCGKWYSRDQKRSYVRWGTERGTAIMNGVKGRVERPRIRPLRNMTENGELKLETYKAMNRVELLEGPLMAAILSGVSARRYASIVSRGLKAKGVSRSAISRKAIAATKPLVDEFLKRKVDAVDPVVLLFDGIHIAKKQMIVCIGIDNSGRKHVLGMKIGATERDIVCRDLIRDLIERGLKPDGHYLFVVDGSKALAAAIRAAFGQDVAIQRCQEHKIRDVQAYVPAQMRPVIRHSMQAAFNERTEKKAFERLAIIRSALWRVSEAAVNSLTEGMYETLTIHRLGVTGLLRKSLRTTNIIESAFSSVRRYMGRVTKFEDEAQIDRWVIRSLIEAERHFRPVQGCRQLAKLRYRLERFDPRTPL
jgi:putative transposase